MATKRSDSRYNTDNPCLREQELSTKCLDENEYNRKRCGMYFDNYKECKKFWNGVVSKRRIEGIKPELPEASEREAMKQEHLKTLREQAK